MKGKTIYKKGKYTIKEKCVFIHNWDKLTRKQQNNFAKRIKKRGYQWSLRIFWGSARLRYTWKEIDGIKQPA